MESIKIIRNEFRQPILKCADCRQRSAILTYEENRIYKVFCPKCGYEHIFEHVSETTAIEHHNMMVKIAEYEDCFELIPADKIHEDYGTVLWWRVPINEPPIVASILDCDFCDEYTDEDGNIKEFTHFSLLPNDFINYDRVKSTLSELNANA